MGKTLLHLTFKIINSVSFLSEKSISILSGFCNFLLIQKSQHVSINFNITKHNMIPFEKSIQHEYSYLNFLSEIHNKKSLNPCRHLSYINHFPYPRKLIQMFYRLDLILYTQQTPVIDFDCFNLTRQFGILLPYRNSFIVFKCWRYLDSYRLKHLHRHHRNGRRDPCLLSFGRRVLRSTPK